MVVAVQAGSIPALESVFRTPTSKSSFQNGKWIAPKHIRVVYYEPMNLVLYSAEWCRDCREAKRFLEKNRIPFTEIDIENTPGAAAEVLSHVGKRAIPQFVIDGEWVQPYRPGEGFLYEEMSVRLGIYR